MDHQQEKEYGRLDNGAALNGRSSGADANDLAEFDRRVRAIVKERPVLAVGIALAAGFAIGRILRRV